jgi:hypothetical protein
MTMPTKRRRRINPFGQQRQFQLVQTFKDMRLLVKLYDANIVAFRRDGDLQRLRQMGATRELMLKYVDILCTPIPDLLPVEELEVVDLAPSKPARGNSFAITHRGRVLKDGFATQGAAMFYLRANLIEPSEIGVRGKRTHSLLEMPDEPFPKSWAIH